VCSKGKEDRDNDASTPCHNRKYDGVLGMLDKVVSVDVASVGSTIYDLIPGEISKHIPSIPELCAKDAKLAKLCGAAKSVLGLDNEAQGTSLSFGPLSVVVTNDDSVFNLPSELVDMLAVTQCPDFEDFMKRNWVFAHLDLASLLNVPGVESLGVGAAVSLGMALIYLRAEIDDVAAAADAIVAAYDNIDGRRRLSSTPYFATTFLKGAKASFRWTHQQCSEELLAETDELGQGGYCALNALSGTRQTLVTIPRPGRCEDTKPQWVDDNGDGCDAYSYKSLKKQPHSSYSPVVSKVRRTQQIFALHDPRR
jgi:hypothetical protein